MSTDPAYPTLTEPQLVLLREYGAIRPVAAGTAVYTPADPHNDLYVVLTGEIGVRDESQGHDTEYARFGPRSFVGELNLLTGQRPYVTARATTDTTVVAISHQRLRDLLDRETDLADILVTAMIARRRLRLANGSADAPIEILGASQSEQVLALRTFLNRNTIPYRFLDAGAAGDPEAHLARHDATRDDLPVVVTPDGVLHRATPGALAQMLGLTARPDDTRVYDVAVVGAGPAGLAAAVYGTSEGLHVAVIDAVAPGGQAGSSSRIENYLGFPDGISGAELTTRATIQAQRFGARVNNPCRVASLEAGPVFTVAFDDGARLSARAVVVATGAQYRRLPLDNWPRLEGAGIYFAATELEAGLSAGGPAFVLGGGNSAGQAALFLARRCTRVTIVIRRDSLTESMSQYLIDRIEAHPLIDVAAGSVIVAVDGGDHLESVTLRHAGADTRHPAVGLFCFIGARPETGWLPAGVQTDEDGFVLTDVEVSGGAALPYETSLPGVFAAGDVRKGSMKRVAAAVGEGSSVIRSVHQRLS